jgi:hypothetical protein
MMIYTYSQTSMRIFAFYYCPFLENLSGQVRNVEKILRKRIKLEESLVFTNTQRLVLGLIVLGLVILCTSLDQTHSHTVLGVFLGLLVGARLTVALSLVGARLTLMVTLSLVVSWLTVIIALSLVVAWPAFLVVL